MKHTLFILGVGALVAGCTLTPKYDRPPAPVSDAWPNGVKQSGTTNAAADIEWRNFFDDPQLQQLIELALKNNRDLRIAALRVEQTRAQYRIQNAALYPGVQGDASVTHQKFSGATSTFNGGAVQTTYNIEVGAAYEVDLFGRVRSLKQEALEKYFSTDEARKSVQIALVSQVASEYLTQVRLREARTVARETLKTVQASYDLIKRSFEAGAASELELRTAEGQVQTVRVNAASFLQLLAESENRLVVLVGQSLPKDLPPGQALRDQHLLTDLPVGIPSEVLQRRPDILAAEHTLKAANANIGAAKAAFFPRIVLTGSAGTASAKLTDLFSGPSLIWSFAPQISVPIFDVGGTRARAAVSKINKEIEIANYEKAIQTAFREVADGLAVRSILDEKLKAQELLLNAFQKRFDLTNARYRQGVDSYVDVLLAQQDLYAAQQNLLQFQAARLLNAVTLYRSLGGGWKLPAS
ncbi:MAG: cation/multidrug efflux system, outer rane channel TolC [Verrucomicrobiales bacterium]|nr:cation/multidrug efflux system, outer rane channel TolC [Verrucomicrobiales bacterium]